jgi:hypothetical protein
VNGVGQAKQARVARRKLGYKLRAGHAREIHVDDHKIDRRPVALRKRRLGRGMGTGHRHVGLRAEKPQQRFQLARIVLHDGD